MEIKFVAPATTRHQLVNWLQMHKAGFYRPYPDRWVNNVYFDTPDYDAVAENISGSSTRAKVRYRWYGPDPLPNPGVLEVKCKRNYYGWKHHFPLQEAPPPSSWTHRGFAAAIRNHLPPEGKAWMESAPCAAMVNRYSRQYFVSADDKIRATIDVGQSVLGQARRRQLKFISGESRPTTLVMEFKFDRHDREQASELLKQFPVRVSAHSKYILGILSTAEV